MLSVREGAKQWGLPMDVLCTDTVPADRRLEYWIDAICQVFVQLECDIDAEAPGFAGRIQRDQLADLRLSVVTADAQLVGRTPRLISRTTEDFFLVSIQRAGTGIVRQDGREARLSSGDFALYDSTRPYQLSFSNSFEQVVLMLPGELLRGYVKHAEALTATAISGREGAGHLLLNMIDTLRRDLDHLQPASAAAIADATVNILVAGLRTLPQAQSIQLPSLALYHIARVKAFIEAHLCDPELSVAMIAAHLTLSEAHLHRLFKTQPETLAQFIWARRLDACKRALGDPAQTHRSLGTLALNYGFNDAAHFSRSFRARFGVTPREYRARTRSAARAL